jgi:hypothetical protein
MKSSDVEKEIARRDGAPVAEVSLGTKLSDANAKKVSKGVVDYRETRIVLTEGAAESTPREYGRDAVMADVFRRKRMHSLLDGMCCDANIDLHEAQTLHDKLDHSLDSDEPLEEEEDAPTGRNKVLHDALDKLIARDRKRRGVVAADRSTAMDASRKRGVCCDDCATRHSSTARCYCPPGTACPGTGRARVVYPN